MLEAIGIDAPEESVYVALLDHPGATVDDLVAPTGLPAALVRQLCTSLAARGLVSRSATRPPRFTPAPPDMALEVLILREQENLERTRLAAAELRERLRRITTPAPGVEDLVEIILGREAIAERFVQLSRSARREVLGFVKPPYATTPLRAEASTSDLIAGGATSRAIYDPEAFSDPGNITPGHVQRMVSSGEEARLAQVPVKMLICDARVALMPQQLDSPGLDGALLIHESPLLSALLVLFERIWEQATPIRFAGGELALEGMTLPSPGMSTSDEALLILLAAGQKDEVIARTLGITRRTVGRRIRALLTDLNATSRFQAGLALGRRGWRPPISG